MIKSTYWNINYKLLLWINKYFIYIIFFYLSLRFIRFYFLLLYNNFYITHTIISLEQILEAYKIFYEEHGTLFDDKTSVSSIISGFGIGNGNCMIPLYINSDHWKLVRIYMEYNNGIIFNRNPLISKKRHTDIYYNSA